MVSLILASTVSYSFINRPVPEAIARKCAADVGIPYASDNFTDAEWRQFQQCIIYRTPQ